MITNYKFKNKLKIISLLILNSWQAHASDRIDNPDLEPKQHQVQADFKTVHILALDDQCEGEFLNHQLKSMGFNRRVKFEIHNYQKLILNRRGKQISNFDIYSLILYGSISSRDIVKKIVNAQNGTYSVLKTQKPLNICYIEQDEILSEKLIAIINSYQK